MNVPKMNTALCNIKRNLQSISGTYCRRHDIYLNSELETILLLLVYTETLLKTNSARQHPI